jgi:methionine-rich copper-binding protein CopC
VYMRSLSTLLLLGFVFNSPVSYAHTHETSSQNTIRVIIKNAPSKIKANTTETLHLQLLKDNKPLRSKDLKTVHTEKVHVMAIDPTLTDYHHIHPRIDNKNKDFVFKFTPKKNSSYRIWVDITPLATNKQVFLKTDIGSFAKKHVINKEVKLNTHVNSYQFTLKLDKKPQVGKPVMAMITVTKDGKPFRQLEPVMGAFAHLMGFSADYSSILHIHPMGKTPSKHSEHGGSQLMFHIEPQKAGFVKLFAQFRINGKDIYVPFGIVIKQ